MMETPAIPELFEFLPLRYSNQRFAHAAQHTQSECPHSNLS
jgi:hypothetical protein